MAPSGTDQVIRFPATRSQDRGWGGRHGRASSRAQPSGFVASPSTPLRATSRSRGSAVRCGGPRTGRVRPPAGGRVGRRAEAGGGGAGGEQLPDGRRAPVCRACLRAARKQVATGRLNPGDDCHRPAVPGTEERIMPSRLPTPSAARPVPCQKSGLGAFVTRGVPASTASRVICLSATWGRTPGKRWNFSWPRALVERTSGGARWKGVRATTLPPDATTGRWCSRSPSISMPAGTVR